MRGTYWVQIYKISEKTLTENKNIHKKNRTGFTAGAGNNKQLLKNNFIRCRASRRYRFLTMFHLVQIY